MMHKPSKADVLKVAEACFCDKESDRHSSDLMRFAAAMYAAGEEAMRERVVVSANKEVSDWEVLRDISVARKESSIIESTNILAINRLIEAIRALPITTTEGEQA